MDVLKIYKYALEREHEGMNFFRQHAGRFAHATAVEVFERLADEEQKHIDFIQGLIDALDEGGGGLDAGAPPRTGAWSVRGGTQGESRTCREEEFFSQRAQSEMLDQTVIESMVPDLAVLRMAYLIERDFAEFYEMAANRVEDSDAQAALHMLARWERGHEQLFARMHDEAFAVYAGMPWGG